MKGGKGKAISLRLFIWLERQRNDVEKWTHPDKKKN